MRHYDRKLTYEDKFARKYVCYMQRGISLVKRANRKEARRKLKQETQKEIIDLIKEEEICLN